VVYCVLSHGAPPPRQNSPKGPPFSCAHQNTPRRSLCFHPPAHAINPGIPALHPGCNCAPCPLPPPYLYTSKDYRAFSLSTSPSLRGKGMFSTFRLRGGGWGTKADTSLFLVSADHMRGSNTLKMSSVEAHGHMGNPPS
jgi:hypothetical protein